MKGLAIAIRSVKADKGSEKELGKGSEYDDVGDELADVLGVPDSKREAFFEALRAFVGMCHEEE